MSIHIRVINPVVKGVLGDDVLPPLPGYVEAELDWIDKGPSSIECRVDHAISVPPLLERVRVAAADGVDGIVLNCFMDTGLQPARELVHIPVAGPAQSSMTLASTLGNTFSVILPAASGRPIVVDEARVYAAPDRLASVRSVEMPVAELHDHDRLCRELIEQAEIALTEDGAEVIILGCTGMSTVTSRVKRELSERGHDVPVIDPTIAAISAVAAQVAAGVHHSGNTYALPSWKLSPAG